MELGGSNQTCILTFENTDITAPVWSLDALKIAFVAWDRSLTKDKESIYTVNKDGTGLRKIFTHQEPYSGASLDWRW